MKGKKSLKARNQSYSQKFPSLPTEANLVFLYTIMAQEIF